MKIMNPIYDNAFKYLMDNEEIAKIVLSIILDTKVLSLQSKPQETPVVQFGDIYLARFDFKAIIRSAQGKEQTVLIEIQKYKSPNPILRFRKYLAQNYMKAETLTTQNGEVTKTLPIITIYILGFDLPEFSCKAIRIDNNPYDIIGQKNLTVKSKFVELLTHQSFILIAAPKPSVVSGKTRLEKFLNLFLQKLEGDPSNPIIEVETDDDTDDEIKKLITHLNHATLDAEIVRRVDAEKDYLKGIENLENQVENERRQKEEAQQREEDERRQKVEIQEKLKKTVKNMYHKALTINEIADITGETYERIQQIVNE